MKCNVCGNEMGLVNKGFGSACVVIFGTNAIDAKLYVCQFNGCWRQDMVVAISDNQNANCCKREVRKKEEHLCVCTTSEHDICCPNRSSL